MKKFLAIALMAAVVLAGCKKDDDPVIKITTDPIAPAAQTEGAINGTLSVTASVTENAKLTYQWYSNTAANNTGGTAISGATEASYKLPTDLKEGIHYYFCEVGAEGAKAIRTAVVTVTVGEKPVTYPITGKAGTLDWSLASDGTLTISGTGAMPDYAASLLTRAGETAPWAVYAAEIKVIVIVEGVTSVGDNAFAGMTVLVTVTLPETIESIGEGAFEGCSVLVEINIPAGTDIGEGAFEGCDELPTGTAPIAVMSVQFDQSSYTVVKGETLTVTGTYTPANATITGTGGTATGASASVMIPGSDGTFSATVYGALEDGEIRYSIHSVNDVVMWATCTFSVVEAAVPVTGVSLNKTTVTLVEGATETLTAIVAPDTATDKAVTWESSDETFAEVDANGKVTAVKAGTATITVTSVADPTKIAECAVTVTAPEPEEDILTATNFPDATFLAYLKQQTAWDTNDDGVLTAEEAAAVTDAIYVEEPTTPITSLKGIEYFTGITELNCSANALTALDLSKNTALQYLYCDVNAITTLNVSKLTALVELNCSENELTSLDVSKNIALKFLSCSENALTSLDISKNIALDELYCGGNPGNSENKFPVTAWFDDGDIPNIDITKGSWEYNDATIIVKYRKAN